MKIKSKLRLGLGTLFFLILALGLIAAKHVYTLKDDTENILADNYQTLDYVQHMLLALDEVKTNPEAWKAFDQNLEKQQRNVTEIGEAEATQKVQDHYDLLKASPQSDTLPVVVRRDLAALAKINMQAIQKKSDIAVGSVRSAIGGIVLTATLCFLIALTLLINLPSNIGNPIRELTESIKEIAAKNYSQRLHFSGKDEFGQLASSFNTMAEKLEEYDNSNLSQILMEKKRTEALINNMHEPVIGLDENKHILFANHEAVKITGMLMSDMLGRSAVDLAVHNDLIRVLIQEKQESNGLTTQASTPSLKIYADDKESYFEKEIVDITIIPTGERQKKFIGQVIILKNITPFKELDFAKTNFIATVSHELKTPISSIKMSLQILENEQTGALNEEQKQLMESIKDDSNRLLKITGELLNMSQVETGNIQLSIQPSSPYAIVRYALDAVKIPLEQKEIELVVQTDENLPDVKADMEKTAWVLINFLTNAIRYSQQEGRLQLELKNGPNGIKFSVRDEGKGIDSRYRNKIFDRYFQIPGSSKTGTGLGLAISKEFIEAQGGVIGVASEIGMGSTFYFELAKA
ncbi:ATP-binding protein [Dyadobacter fanqingshengii]|uniref:histidine kinase n=1 Tax=Dyadobacter fanqingshengii TaxID=2906443 RepID=A0A9X1TAD0_9BACT|nr:ATP-binding protein [Dyadobacter fanqingshengii]MCF0041328.1 cell wall metabolism sensor histidine kinase WalK [Dyadobacter fanqingshengii]USJ36949.1 cell wall metabolism sensor histidine kinase WalK [Dyadobacter fanqingshengii]